jgi:putative ABC transport system permease protein
MSHLTVDQTKKPRRMLRNYLQVAWRNLARYKVYSAINVSGLAIGLAVCMLIVLYVGHEWSYDRFHKNADRIYWIQTKLKLGTDSVYMPFLNYSAAPQVAQREPSVEGFVRIRGSYENVILQNNDDPSLKFAERKFVFADSNFFRFFSFPVVQGSAAKAINEPLSVVLTQRAALKYFGHANPVGKLLRYNNSKNFTVTGVAANPPSNSSIDFDFVASMSSIRAIPELSELASREKNDFTTYFLLKNGAPATRVEAALLQLAKEKEGEGALDMRYVSTVLPKLHAASVSDPSNLKYLRIFPFVAALVLLLALINYMSLSTARAALRAKEIGVRKVLGAGRKIIAMQFFVESIFYTAISFLLGYVLCLLCQPLFFGFLQINIDSSFLSYPPVLAAFAILFLVSALLAATYPAILLSAYRPIAVLYGKLKLNGGMSVRKFFTVVQFAIAVVFIICGFVMQQQLHFFRTKDTGMKRDNLLMIPFGAPVAQHFTAFKEEIRMLPGIAQTSIALHPMFKGYDMMGITPSNGKMMLMPALDVDERFVPLLGLQWKIAPADSLFYHKKNSIILNETAVQKLGLVGNPVSQVLDQFIVAGVLKDFNWSSLQHKIEGLLIFVRPADDSAALWSSKGGCLYANIGAGTNINSLLGKVKNIHDRYDGENPFEYYFMDDAFNDLYKAEDRLASLLTFFTLLAVSIACLGLFGLVTFMATQRTREIGIRKTLGASVQNIVRLLSGDFAILVIIGFLVASPIAWYVMHIWLQDFAYRIHLSWWIFLLGGLLAFIIALSTIATQAIRAAMANPVNSLRTP